MTEIKHKLTVDGYGTPMEKPVEITIELNDRFIAVGIEGYGEKDAEPGHGTPVFLEILGGGPVLRVWANINSEEPTNVVYLDGAREANRDDASA